MLRREICATHPAEESERKLVSQELVPSRTHVLSNTKKFRKKERKVQEKKDHILKKLL